MDILLSIVQLEENSYEEIVVALKNSNLPKKVQWDIVDILDTAVEQTKQAKNMGWL
jgi:hypothetical protein